METLNYRVLEQTGYSGYLLKNAPEKVLQFGEGNFLRAFVNYWLDVSNEKAGWNGKCVLVQPIAPGLADLINAQEGLYTLYLRGRENGEKVDRKRVISSVSRCLNPYRREDYEAMMAVAVSDDLEYIVSNTTEAGIVYDPGCALEDTPAASFPGKLTQVLYARWKAEKGGLVILSCELIDNNGRELLKCVRQYADQWRLEPAFKTWLAGDCTFCSMLVDRIVPGRIRDGSEAARLEAENGYRDALIDVGEVFGVWNIEGPAWLEEKLPFRAAGLNCPVVPDVTPYKKRKVRILNGAHTGFVQGAYLAFYSQDIQELAEQGLICRRPKGDTYVVSDDRPVLEFYYARRGCGPEELVRDVLQNTQMWGQDLSQIPGFAAAVTDRLKLIRTEGAKTAFARCL